MVVKAMDVDIKRFTPKMVAARISDAKNELIGPARYAETAGKDPVSRIVADAYVEYDKRMRASTRWISTTSSCARLTCCATTR